MLIQLTLVIFLSTYPYRWFRSGRAFPWSYIINVVAKSKDDPKLLSGNHKFTLCICTFESARFISSFLSYDTPPLAFRWPSLLMQMPCFVFPSALDLLHCYMYMEAVKYHKEVYTICFGHVECWESYFGIKIIITTSLVTLCNQRN